MGKKLKKLDKKFIHEVTTKRDILSSTTKLKKLARIMQIVVDFLVDWGDASKLRHMTISDKIVRELCWEIHDGKTQWKVFAMKSLKIS